MGCKHLTEVFMVILSNYIRKQQPQLKGQDEIQLVKRIKFITTRKINIDQADYYIEDRQYFKRLTSIALISLHQAINTYLLYNELLFTFHRYLRINSEYYNCMVAYINQINQHSHAFRYVHFAVFHIAFHMNKFTLCKSIYNIFYEQFRYFQEHQYFEIFYLNQLFALKNVLLSRLMVERRWISKTAQTHSTKDIYQKLFRTLHYIIENNQNFHVYLSTFLSVTPARADKPYMDLLAIFYQKYKPKLFTFTSFEHARNKFKPICSLKKPIQNINKLFQYPIEPLQDKNRILGQFRNNVLTVLDQVDCFECKVFSLIEVKLLQVNISEIGEEQQSFRLLIGLLTLHMKNPELRSRAFPILWVIVCKWRNSSFLYKNYDLREFYYDIIKQSGRFQYCLVDLGIYNIFVNLYLKIAQQDHEELANFLINIVEAIQENKADEFIDHFYYSLGYIVLINTKMIASSQFVRYHQVVISYFISIQKRKNPFLSIYYSALLKINIRKDIALKVLVMISQSFNQITRHAKNLIIDQYYSQFIQYLGVSSRRQRYIFNRHLKCTLDKLKLKFILKAKLGKQIPRQKQKRLAKLIRKHIVRYYQVVGNIA